jgi:hypothetical protein
MYACLHNRQTTNHVPVCVTALITASDRCTHRQQTATAQTSPFDPFWLTIMGTLLCSTQRALIRCSCDTPFVSSFISGCAFQSCCLLCCCC